MLFFQNDIFIQGKKDFAQLFMQDCLLNIYRKLLCHYVKKKCDMYISHCLYRDMYQGSSNEGSQHIISKVI